MGTGNIHGVRTGDPATADDVNQFDSALRGDHVPRGSGGSPSAGAGNLGTASYPWNTTYTNQLVVNGVEITANRPDGSGSISPAASVQNGVVSGQSPAGEPGMCGWMFQAGASGVRLQASAAEPLVVKLDGVSYQLESDLTGGTLPADFTSPALNFQDSTGSGFRAQGQGVSYQAQRYTREAYKYLTGAAFYYASTLQTELPAAYGDTLIFKTATDNYIVAQRNTEQAIYGDIALRTAKLAATQVMNTSSTGFDNPRASVPSGGAVTAVRCGYVFLNPRTNPFSITISKRIVGSADAELPGVEGYEAGDVVFLELDQRWYRFNGTTWQRSDLVYLGIVAIEGGQVRAAAGVRSEESLALLYERKFAVLGEPIIREGVLDDAGENVYFGGDTSGDIETKGPAELQSQSFDKVGTDARINLADDGTKENSKLYCAYLAVGGDAEEYFYEETPPVYQLYRGRLLLLHPHKQALLVGSFATDASGSVIARYRIGSDSNRWRLSESNDDRFLVNPSLWPRARMTQLSANVSARMGIQLRNAAGNTSSLNPVSNRVDSYAEWNGYFYDSIKPYVIEQIRYDVDAPPGSNDHQFEITDWTERDLLHAVRLGAAGREGRPNTLSGVTAPGESTGGIGGAAPADSISGYNLARGAVGYENIDPGAIATESEILLPNSADPKIVNNIALNDKLEEFERQLGAHWSSWATPTMTNDTTTADNAVATIGGVGSVLVRNASGYNMKTAVISAGSLVFALPACSDGPALTSGTIRGTLLFEVGGRRWAYPVDNPEGPDTEEIFYLDGGEWIAQAYNGDELETSFGSLPDDNRWRPVTGVAHDEPQDNALRENMIIAKRSGNTESAFSIIYNTNNNRTEWAATTRTYTISGGGGGGGQPDPNSVGPTELQDRSVTSVKIALGGVESTNLAGDAVVEGKVADDAIVPDNIKATGTPTATSYLGYNASGDFAVKELPDPPAFTAATSAQVEQGTANDSAITPQAYQPFLRSDRRQLEALWDGWGGTQLASQSLTATGDATINAAQRIKYSRTLSTPAAGDVLLLGGNVAGPIPQSGETRHAGIVVRSPYADATRPLLLADITTRSGESQPSARFYIGNTSGSGSWQEQDIEQGLLLSSRKENAAYFFDATLAADAPTGGRQFFVVRNTGSQLLAVAVAISGSNALVSYWTRDRADDLLPADSVGAREIDFAGSPTSGNVLSFNASGELASTTPSGGNATLADGSVTHPKLAAAAVESDNLAADAVGNAALQDDAVNTENIVASAITQAKMAADSVGVAQVKTTNAGSDGQVLVKRGTNFTYEDQTASGSGDAFTEEVIYSNSSGLRRPTLATTPISLDTGKSFADYDDIMVVFGHDQFTVSGTPAHFRYHGKWTSAEFFRSNSEYGSGNPLNTFGIPVEYHDWNGMVLYRTDTTFLYIADESALEIYEIRGRKYHALGSGGGGGGGLPGTNTITNAMLRDGIITNAEVAANAAIAQSKLADLTAADLPSGTLVYHGTAADGQIAVYNDANDRWQLEAKPSASVADGSITNAKVASDANIAQSKLNLAITNSEVAADAAIAQSKLSLSISNADVSSSAAIAQSKLADITADDLPTIPYTKLSGTPTIPTELPPTDGSVTNAKVSASAAIAQSKLSLAITNSEVASDAAIAQSKLSLSIGNDEVASDAAIAQSKLEDLSTSDLPDGTLFYTGTPSGDQIPVYNSTNSRWQLEAKPSGGGGGLTIGGTKAAGKVIKATGTGADDQSWADDDTTPADGSITAAKMAADAVGPAAINSTTDGSDDQLLVKAGTQFAYRAYPDGGDKLGYGHAVVSNHVTTSITNSTSITNANLPASIYEVRGSVALPDGRPPAGTLYITDFITGSGPDLPSGKTRAARLVWSSSGGSARIGVLDIFTDGTFQARGRRVAAFNSGSWQGEGGTPDSLNPISTITGATTGQWLLLRNDSLERPGDDDGPYLVFKSATDQSAFVLRVVGSGDTSAQAMRMQAWRSRPLLATESTIADGAINNAKVASNAAIAQSKLSLSIANSDVASDAAIAQSKLADLTLNDLPIHGTPADGQVPTYSTANTRLEYATPSGGGGATDITHNPIYWTGWSRYVTTYQTGNDGVLINGLGYKLENSQSFNWQTKTLTGDDEHTLFIKGKSAGSNAPGSAGSSVGGVFGRSSGDTYVFLLNFSSGDRFFTRSGSTWTEINSANNNEGLIYTDDEIFTLPDDGRWYPVVDSTLTDFGQNTRFLGQRRGRSIVIARCYIGDFGTNPAIVFSLRRRLRIGGPERVELLRLTSGALNTTQRLLPGLFGPNELQSLHVMRRTSTSGSTSTRTSVLASLPYIPDYLYLASYFNVSPLTLSAGLGGDSSNSRTDIMGLASSSTFGAASNQPVVIEGLW